MTMNGVKIMKQRIDYKKIAPDGFKAMLNLENYVRNSGLEHSLLELVKTRVSQINGCAHCLDMHTKDARAAGETEQRLNVLAAWRDAPFYSDRERAALAWAEAVTQLSTHDIADELYAEVRRHFDEKPLVDLTFAIVAINGWNRLAVPLRAEVGSYQPKARHAA
jgi:AhpD family alkylhydroperoxidase